MSGRASRWKALVSWALAAPLGAVFLFAGGTKIVGAAMQVETFARLGLPDWSRPLVGGVEFIASLLVVAPPTRSYGGAIIAATMMGAALTHVVSGVDVGMVMVNAALFVPAVVLAWMHRPVISRPYVLERSAA